MLAGVHGWMSDLYLLFRLLIVAQRDERSEHALTAGWTAAVNPYDKFLATPTGRP